MKKFLFFVCFSIISVSFFPQYLIKNFDDGSLTSGGWQTFWSGANPNIGEWEILFGNIAKASNYSNFNNYACESWLVSPSIDLSSSSAPFLIFDNDVRYLGSQLELYISSNYDGVSNPNVQGTWINLTNYVPNWDSDNSNWGFVSSGNTDLTNFISSSVTIAFKYIGTNIDGATWEIDNIIIDEPPCIISPPSPPDPCLVTYSSISNSNRVVWERPINDAIDSFYVNKETSQSNTYQKIGAIQYSETCVFDDLSSNPSVQANKYKLSYVDTCGNESSMGSFHKTIHLTINQGVGTSWNLIWSHYEGFGYSTYNIYRGNSQNNIALLDTVASNINSYTDINAPNGQLFYQIEVLVGAVCDPSRTYSSTKSNFINNQIPTSKLEFIRNRIKYYPNPTNENITISVNNFNGIIQTEIYDLLGHRLQTTNETTISLQEYARGIYILKVAYGDRVEKLKVIKE